VEWDEISGRARHCRSGLRDFRVTLRRAAISSRTSPLFRIGYFTVNPDAGRFGRLGVVSEQSSVNEDGSSAICRFDAPMRVVMRQQTSQGVFSSRRRRRQTPVLAENLR